MVYRNFVYGLLVLLAACVSPQQAQWQRDEYESSECSHLGYHSGMQEFADCRLRIRQISAEQEQAAAIRQVANSRRHDFNYDYINESNPNCKKTHGGNIICKSW